MQVTTIQGIVKNGKIHLTEDFELPEETKVYIVIPPSDNVKKIMSPQLVDKTDAKVFKKIVEDDIDDGIQ